MYRFSFNEKLVSLWINWCKLTALAPGLFGNLISLQSLFLDNNALTSLHPDQFSNNHYLQTLWLNSNDFRTLDPSIFSSNTELKYLDLSQNMELTEISPLQFANLTQLSWLSCDCVDGCPNHSLCTTTIYVNEESITIDSYPFGIPSDADNITISLTYSTSTVCVIVYLIYRKTSYFFLNCLDMNMLVSWNRSTSYAYQLLSYTPK